MYGPDLWVKEKDNSNDSKKNDNVYLQSTMTDTNDEK